MTPEELSEYRALADRLFAGHEEVYEAGEAILRLIDALDAARASALEEAAKICESRYPPKMFSAPHDDWVKADEAKDCARAIRAAKETPTKDQL